MSEEGQKICRVIIRACKFLIKLLEELCDNKENVKG